MGGGLYNNEYEKLTMVNPEIPKLPGRPFRRRNQSNPDCIIFKSLEPISDILGDEFHAIALRVSLKHGLTGLSNVFEQEYANIEDIRTGRYKPGTKFETI